MALFTEVFAMTFACFLAGANIEESKETRFTPVQVRDDLDELLGVIGRTHPDLGYVADRAMLQREAVRIRSEIVAPMTVRQVWLSLARLNPYFSDAHTGLRHPTTQFDAYREAGGAVFSLPVIVDRTGKLRVAYGVAPNAGVSPFEQIIAINGRSSEEVVAKLMLRMRGETDSLRRLVLAFNFPAYLWTLEGPADSYRIEVMGDDGRQRTLQLGVAYTTDGARLAPSLSFLAHGLALMRVPSFDPSLKSEFATFLERSMIEIEAKSATTLLIDIRDNPGGAHDVSDQLVAWLTRTPVSPTSTLTARITPDNRDISPAAPVGSVITAPFEEPIQPRRDGRQFRGNVYVLVSEDTYSQAIVFAATIQDNGLGKLVGEATGGAANQTGQITLHPLTHSKLQALAPLYIIYRPNGDKSRGGLVPDIPLSHDPAHADAMIRQLLSVLPVASAETVD